MSAIKFNSDTGGSVTLKASAVASAIEVFLPKQPGTISVGPAYFVDDVFPAGFDSEVSDCTPYIQAALNNYGAVQLSPGRRYRAHNLQSVPNGRLVCIGGRATIVVPSGANRVGITVNTTNFMIDGVNFDGGDLGPYNLTGKAVGTRIGILVGNAFGTSTSAIQGLEIQNVDVYGFDSSGVQVREIQLGFVFGKRLSMHNVNAYKNFANIWMSPRAEYCVLTSCYGYEGYAGIIMQAGNNKAIGCHFENNFQNCQMAPGENDGHGSFIGCSFNHAAAGGVGLFAQGIVYGMVFVGCHFWYAGITLNDCAGISITDGQIAGPSPILIIGGGLNWIDNNYTPNGLTKTFTGFTFTTFRGNRVSTTDTSIAPTSGDVNVQCNSITTAYPVAWNATTDTKLPVVASLAKWHGEDVNWLNPSNDIYFPITGWYSVDAVLTFTVGAAAERPVLKISQLRSSSEVYTESSSAYGLAGQTEVSVRLNTQIFALQGDVLRFLFKTLTATGVSIPTGGIKIRVRSEL
jgi:hypothetical protein